MIRSAKDYPEHLNPFDENYNGLAEPANSRQKYNTWSSGRPNNLSLLVKPKPKPTLLEKPWAALNISPKGKLVRRLSILKTAVERFATKKNQLTHSSSDPEANLPPRSHSVHEDFNFKIFSPKLKEKLRQQAFSRSISRQDQDENSLESPDTPPINGRLELPLKLDVEEPLKVDDCSPTSPESTGEFSLTGARPKTRKKRPPPPPPAVTVKTTNLELSNGQERAEDTLSANSSITQDLEKDASSEEESSLTELQHHKVDHKMTDVEIKTCV